MAIGRGGEFACAGNVIVAPIQIAESGADDALWAADAQVRVIGWGNAEPFGAPTSRDGLSDTLHEAEIPVVADAQCARAHPWGAIGAPGFDPATMLCAGETHGTEGPCDGDAGGPLVARRPAAGTAVLVGTVSWGMGCGLPAQPDVFARVGEAALGRWIRHHLASPSADAPAADLAGASGRPRAPARMTIGRVRRRGRVLVVQVVVSSSVRGARVAVYRGSRRLATTPGSGRLHAGSHRLALRLPAAAASGRLELVASARVGSRKLLARRRVWIGR